jgi:ribose transport system substrate-binding protein
MKAWGIGIFALSAGLLAGCGGNKTAPPATGGAESKTIGVTLLARTDPFYKDLEESMQEEAKAKGYTLDVQDGRRDLSKQLSQVETFIAQKKDAIVLCPVNSEGVGRAIEKANAAGIPVFTADIRSAGGKVVSHIASDNVAGGRLAGEYLGKLLNGKGNVVILDYPTVASVQERTKGFMEAMAKFPGIKIVERPSGGGERAKSMAQMENMLQKHPNLDGVFAINDSTGMGALKALEDHKNTHIVMVGYDGDAEARAAILRGSALKADAVQYPREIGKATIDAIAENFEGKTPSAFVPVKVGIIDQASLKAEAAKHFFRGMGRGPGGGGRTRPRWTIPLRASASCAGWPTTASLSSWWRSPPISTTPHTVCSASRTTCAISACRSASTPSSPSA